MFLPVKPNARVCLLENPKKTGRFVLEGGGQNLSTLELEVLCVVEWDDGTKETIDCTKIGFHPEDVNKEATEVMVAMGTAHREKREVKNDWSN